MLDTDSAKHRKLLLEVVIYAFAGILFGGIFFRQILLSHFDLLLGDLSDARFNGVILEHWWQVLNGSAQWLSPVFYFPVQGVLGYGDAGFLNALPYVALRFLGLDPFTSCQIVLFALVALGWVGAIVFLRCLLKLSMLPAIVGALLFVFPNAMAASAQHTQLFTVYFIPWVAVALYMFLSNFPKANSLGIISGIFLAFILPAMCYTSFYIGWFAIFFLLILAAICFASDLLHSGRAAAWRSLFCKWGTWRALLPYCALGAICLIPFLITYMPTLRQFHGRSHQESRLPSFVDYVNLGPSNWLWGARLYSTVTRFAAQANTRELSKGVPCYLLLTFLAASFYFIRKSRHYQLTLTQSGACTFFADRKEAARDDKLDILAARLGVAVLLAWLLMLKIGDYSLWWLVTYLVPGASSLRGVSRFQHVLAFPIAIVLAIGLHQAMTSIAAEAHSRAKRFAYLAAFSCFCLLLAGEELNLGSIANWSKQEQRNMLARIPRPPQQASVFAILPVEGAEKHFAVAHVDAMIIAQKYGLRTINGYSGLFPRGWEALFDFHEPEYIMALDRWIEHYHLENDHLFILDAQTCSWLPAKTLHDRVYCVIMSGPLEEKDFALALSADTVPTHWQRNEVRRCAVSALNNGTVGLSSVSSDFDDTARYAVRLSYRWIEAGSAAQPFAGFDTRTALPGSVKPKGVIEVNMDIKAPSRPGKYWLEIEAVQESVSWFKERGCPGVQIEAEVR